MTLRNRFGIVVLPLLILILFILPSSVHSFNFDVGLDIENISQELVLGETFYYIKNVTLNNVMILSLAGFAKIDYGGESIRLYNKNVSIRQSTYYYKFTPENLGEHRFNHEFRLGGKDYNNEVVFNVVEKEIPSEESIFEETYQEIDDKNYSKDLINDSLPYMINFSSSYYYEYGPVILIGNITLDEDYVGNEFVANFSISSVNNNRSAECIIEFNKSRMFYCELQNTGIELSDYEIFGNVISEFEKYALLPFYHKFRLALKDESSISLDIFHNDSLVSGDSQKIRIHAYDGRNDLTGAEVLVKLNGPQGIIKTYSAQELSNGTYISDFIVGHPGNYDYEVTFVLGNRYRRGFGTFNVERKNLSLEVLLDGLSDNYIFHNYGPLNITGNFSITNIANITNQDNYLENISIELIDVNGASRYCKYECEDICFFNCELIQNILYDNYILNISVLDNEVIYSTSSNFTVGFSEATEIDFSLSYSEYYLIEEMQNFFFIPSKNGEFVSEGTLFVEIIDPLNISYGISTQRTYEGYAFNFIGMVPGEYTIEIKLLTKEGLKTEKFTYSVIEEYTEHSDEKHISLARRERDIRDALSYSLLKEFKNSNETSLFIQLPTRIDENVRWLRLSKHNFSTERNYEFTERINLMNYINRIFRNDFQNIRLHYIETEKIPYTIETFENFKVIDMGKPISPFSEEYKNIEIIFEFDDMSRVSKENIIVYEEFDNIRSIIRNVMYFDDSDNGLIDRLSFKSLNISERKFVVEQSIDVTSFIIPEEVQGVQNSQTKFVVRYANPDVRVSELPVEQCSLVINNITYPMVPVKTENAYVLNKIFDRPGRFEYKVFCGKNVIKSNFIIRPGRTDVKPSSLRSNLYNKGEKERLSISSHIPVNFFRDGLLQDIERNFIPRLKDDRIDSLYYTVERGLFNVSLSSLNNEFPFLYSKGNINISFRLDSLVFYDTSSLETAVFARPDQLSNYLSDNNVLRYLDVFGENTELVFTYRSAELKKELLLSNSTLVIEPGEVGMNENETYVMMKSVIDIGDYIIDAQSTYDEIYIRDEDYIEAGVYIKRDYYYLPGNEGNRRAMFRVIYEKDGVYYMLSGIPYSEFKNYEEIIFDPTFSILSNNRDAMSYDNQIILDYYDEDSQYLFFGRNNDEVYEAGMQFELYVPKNAIITDAYISLTSGDNQSSNVDARIFIENTTNSNSFSSGFGKISDRDYLENYVEWSISSLWNNLTTYNTPNISSLIQYVVNKDDWESGNYISLMLIDDGGSTGYRSFHGYSSPGTNVPVLSVTYLSEESEPIISLISPEDNEILANENITFEYTVEDDDGIDVCELWGNFTGVWQLNQTDTDVSVGGINNFTIIGVGDGIYEWNVWCNDSMGNSAFNSTNSTFTLNTTLQATSLEIFSDHNISSNVSIFQDTGFYAEFLDSELNPIEDAVCKIQFEDSEEDMIYDPVQSRYKFNRTFETPYLQQYNVSCEKMFYDGAFETSQLYIYPIVNASVEKEISSIEGGYSVTLRFGNSMNISVYVNITDFVTSSFVENFDQSPISSNFVYGAFEGTKHTWNILLDSGETSKINYNITPVVDVYSILDLQLIGVGSHLQN